MKYKPKHSKRNYSLVILAWIICAYSCSHQANTKGSDPEVVQEKSYSEESVSSAEIGEAYGPPQPGIEKKIEPAAKLCIILGPGAALGFSEVGVLEILQQAKIKPDCIIGLEMGAYIGAVYANTLNTNQLEWQVFKLQDEQFWQFPIIKFQSSLASPQKFYDHVKEYFGGKTRKDLKLDFFPVVQELGKNYLNTESDLPLADLIAGSVAVQGIFSGWKRLNWSVDRFYDPVHLAREKFAATTILYVDVLPNSPTNSSNELHKRYMSTFGRFQNARKISPDIILIHPETEGYEFQDFSKRSELVGKGRDKMSELLESVSAIWIKDQARATGVEQKVEVK